MLLSGDKDKYIQECGFEADDTVFYCVLYTMWYRYKEKNAQGLIDTTENKLMEIGLLDRSKNMLKDLDYQEVVNLLESCKFERKEVYKKEIEYENPRRVAIA